MQITFDIGYSRWVADVSGTELEALTALMSKATKCKNAWADSEENKTGTLQVESADRMDIGIKVHAQPLRTVEWIEPPKPDPVPASPVAPLANIAPKVETPDMRDFMDEQLASPVPEEFA